jgi:ABC-type polysaccharide/polyol phosphate transport system ATPase subunit
MTPTTTLHFDHVSKLYRQRHEHAHDTDLWALWDVDFACREGEVLGLVGRNGCGKSTILKLAARVTTPTRGSVSCSPEVAPMLELGAGFHPDLTGRDNIKLNGSLLGMGRHLSASVVDEIVAFAEVEQHVDTPVKHYSSGMLARLGFAVAVHSPARLLLVDEVLSVGDRLFQQKCLARMKYLRDRGTTIVLVSHEDWWIRSFCTRALLLDGGRVVADGDPENVLRAYDLRLRSADTRRSDGVEIGPVEVLDEEDRPRRSMVGPTLRVRVRYATPAGAEARWQLMVNVRREDGVRVALLATALPPQSPSGVVTLDLANLHLVVGSYVAEASLEDVATLQAAVTEVSEPFRAPGAFDARRGFEGVVRPEHVWRFG